MRPVSDLNNMDRAGRLFETFVVVLMEDTGFSKQEVARFLAGLAAGFSNGVGYSWKEFEEQARFGWGAAKSAGDA